jgi:agmatine deiminase
VEVLPVEADDAWLRDTGPCFTCSTRGERRALAFRFNAWGGAEGGLYADWSRDAMVAARIAELAGWPWRQVPLVLEGGAIHGDGAGTGLSTATCLPAANRNPGMSRSELEASLREWLGFERLIWLPAGLAGDETGGHIDNLACFLAPGRVAVAATDDPASPHAEACRLARQVLEAARDARDRPLEVVPIPLPEGVPPMSAAEAAGVLPRAGSRPRRAGTPLTASYLNAVFATGAVVIPSFGVDTDLAACRAWAAALPGRRIVQFPAAASREILLGGGGLHCVTLGEPQPAGAPPDSG